MELESLHLEVVTIVATDVIVGVVVVVVGIGVGLIVALRFLHDLAVHSEVLAVRRHLFDEVGVLLAHHHGFGWWQIGLEQAALEVGFLGLQL